MALHQFDYIFAIGMLFAFLDAWNIGANDVANSWASSVGSRALTYPQAMCLAAIMEFLGAVLSGSRVTDTVRNKITDVSVYTDAPAGLMLLMACALVGSSLWLTLATSVGAPCSTTHSIVGGIIGASIAANGAGSVHWGWSGFSKIVASWFIAPGIAGAFALCVFYITKYLVLERENALKYALISVPVYFFATFAILTMSIVWKGAPNLKLDKLSDGAIAGSILGVGAVSVVVYFVFFLPFFYRRLILEDWQIKYYHVFFGPLLWFRSKEIPPIPEGHELILDYYNKNPRGIKPHVPKDAENSPETIRADMTPDMKTGLTVESGSEYNLPQAAVPFEEPKGFHDGKIVDITSHTWRILIKPRNWHRLLWVLFTRGLTQDVLGSQVDPSQTGGTVLGKGVEQMHASSKRYDLKVEHVYSFLQCLTACTMSWSHGSNDISNACAPLSTIYLVWSQNQTGEKAPVPIWVLVYTAIALVIGLWTYGYHIMRNLGNRLILQSPARGFCIELGAAITVVFASRLGLPISTTQCIVGATVMVGLGNNTFKSVNWRIVLLCYFGWFVTVPCAGIISGIIMGIIINAPRIGQAYTMQ